ncbi:MAG: cation-translocating P-type ATPase [Sporocytophaga sp.]|uniref:cation-translocating P-type ATPase n=1 Tax=Sporocytophaga sp. TaxID=2231183 RepID=UPI001B018B8E|nr:cation-translocating P-type ATPase [Sporocytophaga sp.]MBO9701623.1 cation-translocating P-type ATPase [Sporocytophaga sp.]
MTFKESKEEVLERLKTNSLNGLAQQEAKRRLDQNGYNEFEEQKKETLLQKSLHHLTEITSIILMIAAAIAGYVAVTQGSGWAKVFVILSIVIINVVVAVYQESKSEAALEALKRLNTNTTTVIRDGKKFRIKANELVPGDLVEFNSGDIITADCQLLETNSLQVDEASLTGESEPILKNENFRSQDNSPIGDRFDWVFSGTLVTNGKGRAVVVKTAMNTEMGKIAKLLNETEKLKTPLQIKLAQLSKRLSFIALLAAIAVFLIGIFIHNHSTPDMLLIGISLGVAAVPETLPIIVTMILSRGVFNMVKKNTIIRKIPAIETIGNTSVICSDKTGTLTQNKMKIQQIWIGSSEATHATEEFSKEEMKTLVLLTVCSNATIEVDDEGNEKVMGDPTELAIIRLLHKKGLTRVDAEREFPKAEELPFDSKRKLMTTLHHLEDGDYLVVTKGAFDRIPVSWQNAEQRLKAQKIHDEFASKALRVIAIATKKITKRPEVINEEALESNLEFLGLIGMIDPPREESKEAVKQAKEAGIKTIMITGDHKLTALAIAKEIGILEDEKLQLVVTGQELSKMSDDELKEKIKNISVYARVSPQDKIRIVQAWQSKGEVVAMTGDGVNDAPALKAADVGIAMGITGTEVSKNASDMIITDDNFATIVSAIKEGRTSFDNIRKTIYFLLSVNFAQIFIMLAGVTLGWGAPLTAVQILMVNVIADGIPGFFLSFEKSERGVMKRLPLRKDSGVFSDGLGLKIFQRSLNFVIIVLLAFFLGANAFEIGSRELGVSMAFIVMSLSSALNIFNIRSKDSILVTGLLENRKLFLGTLTSVFLTVLIIFIPILRQTFEVIPLNGLQWLIVIILGISPILVNEIQKFIESKYKIE